MKPRPNYLKIVVGCMMILGLPQILTLYFTDPLWHHAGFLIAGGIFFVWGIFLVYLGLYPRNTK